MRELIELIQEAALITNIEGKIIAVNEALVQMFGYEEEDELLMEEIEILVPMASRKTHRQCIRNFMECPTKTEFGRLPNPKGIKKSGDTISLDIMLTPIPIENTVIVIAIVRNLDKIREVSTKLQRMLKKLNGNH